jgi:O-antigen/teichoic acid export membrane protein
MTKQLRQNVALSVAQTIVSGIVLFVLYRYLVRRLGPEQLGLWSVILASTSVARLSELGMTGSVVRFMARYRAEHEDQQCSEVIQTATISIAGSMMILSVAAFPFLSGILTHFLPITAMPLAVTLLPWAVSSLWLTSVAAVFQSGLDGCQRMDLKNIIMIIGNIMFLLASFALVPTYGLEGLAISQVAQAAFILISSWVALRRQISELPIIPFNWSASKFKEMLHYAVNLQIASVTLLFFDPVTKMLMSRYGGLSSAGYYEMASQVVVKVRAVLTSASQALTPAAAELPKEAIRQVCELYNKSYQLVFFATILIFTALVLAFPPLSIIWIGQIDNEFIGPGIILAIGWGLNTLSTPAYFINLGTGDLQWNTFSHALIAVVNLSLGVALGHAYGTFGIASAAMISLIAGSAFLIGNVHQRFHLSLVDLVPRQHRGLTIGAALGLGLSYFAFQTTLFNLSPLARVAGSLGGSLILAAITLRRHPTINQLRRFIPFA